MENNDTIEILLATYNGAKFIEEQLDSIARQTYKNIFVTIRDDGSKDNTVEIMERYRASHPGLIRDIIVNNTDRHGALTNFAALFAQSSAEYVMFSDQDDVWLNDKVEKTMTAMKKAEKEFPGIGIAVHTDMYVTDDVLNITSQSFFETDRIVPANNDLASLLCSNTITGCNVMINRTLADKIGAIPDSAVMHDSWIALCASAFGKIITLYEPTMYYRQHASNEIGVIKRPNVFVRTFSYFFDKKKKQTYSKTASGLYRAADAFAEMYSDKLSAEQYDLCRTYADMKNKPALIRLITIMKYGFGGRSISRRIKCWLLLNKEKYSRKDNR